MSAQYWQQNRNAWATLLLGVLVLAAAGGFLYWAVHGGEAGKPVGVAQVVSSAVGAAALGKVVVDLIAWSRKRRAPTRGLTSEEVVTAKDILAGLVTQQWHAETIRRSLGDPAPMPLAWRSTERRELADHPEIIAEGAVVFPGLGVHMADIARNFRALRCRRLVILGGPGTGKTTLAVQLLLELLRTRQPEEPVPVLLSASRWSDRPYPQLRDWLVADLAMDYPALRAEDLGPDIPETLVARGEVLPVIDGLDELPEHARAGLLAALNRSMGEGDQLILTCRTKQFAESVEEMGDVLTAAAVIEPQSMGPDAAAEYLRQCLPPVPHPTWSKVLEALRTGTAPALAEVASTSLGLWLVRVTYIAPRVDPTPLLELGRGSAAELHDHLCDQLIPALVSAVPPADGPAQPFRPQHAWTPEQVSHWLMFLSRNLAAQDEGPQGMAWWHLARRTPSYLARVGCGIAIGVMVWLAFALVADLPVAGVVIGLLSALAFVIMTGPWFTESPGHADFRFHGKASDMLGVLGEGLAAGVMGALIGALMAFPAGGMQVVLKGAREIGLMSGIGFVAVLGLIRWVERPTTDATASSPRSTWQADRKLTAIRIVGGLVVGLMVAIIVNEAKFGIKVAIISGLLLGLLAGLMLGRHHAWLAYNLTVPHLARKGSLPLRAMDFLDDAHRLGLLRAEGPYYQFRHVELQQHLAHKVQETPADKPRQPAPLP
ncbi:NACHT domain-containing protein [Nonomuraea sp. NPDC050643]|uniref:NACHT domain-containing protein n=1 Tax=Nonomuraea sp. NPDC050643 TaxID=3155660 RepID=UPI00340C208D